MEAHLTRVVGLFRDGDMPDWSLDDILSHGGFNN